ncbi:MAG: hypothetical protein BIFFINMI_01514 [Phycisphaerae bacterium]|nr:hypothetical protein [Phycisphaerae bacterium]
MKPFAFCLTVLLACAAALADDAKVANVKAVSHDGQTFVTWTDVAEGEAGKDFRYNLYRSDQPITQDSLAAAELAISGIENNSACQYGYGMNAKSRIEPKRPMAIIVAGGQPLPEWSGLAVRTVEKDGRSFYAVVATDLSGKAVSQVVPSQSATTEAVEEKVAPIQPIKIGDSATRGQYAAVVKVTGAKNLPLMVNLHASSAQGGPGYDHGDYYLMWSRRDWGYRDGLPWEFTVHERDYGKDVGRRLEFNSRETMVRPDGMSTVETYWFGYYCKPQGSNDPPRAYNFTEMRALWMVRWVIDRYGVDPNRVYATGGSMGAWGSSTFAFRQAGLFAAVYPNRPRTKQRGLPALTKMTPPVLMPDGKTDYYERMDMTKFAVENHGDLPFLGWCCGRRDGFASFKEQVDMVAAMTAAHHGFAFAWNDGDHSSGAVPMREVMKYYPPQKFALNLSYPAFGNSSINDDIGSGELVEKTVTENGKERKVRVVKDGQLEGGINLGFDWTDVAETADSWSAKISNSLCRDAMTVDVTPRQCQQFKPKAGDKFKWSASSGQSGDVTADPWGLVTIEKLQIKPGQATELKISR